MTTVFAGETFEWTGSTATMKKYYYAGQRRVAMRVGSTLYYLLADHLGSTTVAAASDASLQSRKVYGPWGEVRGETGALPTSFQFTGQRKAELAGVHFFQARYYDSLAGVFLQPDSLVPDPYNPLDWNRFLYVRGNAVNYTDPTGHMVACDKDDWACQTHWDDPVVEEEPYVPGPLDPVIEFAVTAAFEPLDWMNMADLCLHNQCSPWFLLSMAPLIPGSIGKYMDDLVELVPANSLHWSQKGISQATKDGLLLDDLAQSMAQGWKDDPLKVLEIDGKLVSLDNRRLTVAKMLDIDVPVTISKGHTVAELITVFKRDGIFTQIPIRGTDMIIDMFGRLLGR